MIKPIFLGIITVATAWGVATGDHECNGFIAVVPPDPPPWPRMQCRNLSCGTSCSLDSMQLDVNAELWWCECDPSGEPSCCHTIQKKIDGEWQQPTGWGPCRSGCGGDSCSGNAGDGFECE
ncbi:MAG: hypothetical protein CMJ84_15460 [Planctomycetes bacterium]|jgi:hypothetical protein|nr:hypothetical protein [Planctomycetota bacterium]MDP6410595.1 hypothetical protein [Planctomycetota bacterium]